MDLLSRSMRALRRPVAFVITLLGAAAVAPTALCQSADSYGGIYGSSIYDDAESQLAPLNVGLSADEDAPVASGSLQGGAPAAATACNCPACQAARKAGNPPAKGLTTCCHGRSLDWIKFPATIRPMARPGDFPIPPAPEPGYYSLWDAVEGTCREAPPKSGYAPFAINAWPNFDADWRFVETIPEEQRTFVEKLKRIHLNDCWLLSTGGSYWVRYHNEHNSRLTNVNNDYHLQRVRLFSDLWYSDWLRIYGEYVWADSFGESLPPGPADVDLGDIQDLFIDLNLLDVGGKPVYLRSGRQELLFGSQRLVTALPWANKRHTFEGFRLFRQGEQWDVDAFWTRFVPAQASEFDEPDNNRELAGCWITHRPRKGEFLDFYYLYCDNENDLPPRQGIQQTPFQTQTGGMRWTGDNEGRLWDFEGAMQFGDQDSRDVVAGMATAGIGRNWQEAPLAPTAWLYYDYASGDSDPDAGGAHTFNPVFPFGHYYLGWMDLVGRQNIHDLNAHLFLYPTPWVTVWLQYHRFWLDSSTDALYNAGGVVLRRDATGAAGTNVGDEVDVVVNFHLTRYSDILVSYNKLFGGSFLEATSGPGLAEDAESLYLLFQQRF